MINMDLLRMAGEIPGRRVAMQPNDRHSGTGLYHPIHVDIAGRRVWHRPPGRNLTLIYPNLGHLDRSIMEES